MYAIFIVISLVPGSIGIQDRLYAFKIRARRTVWCIPVEQVTRKGSSSAQAHFRSSISGKRGPPASYCRSLQSATIWLSWKWPQVGDLSTFCGPGIGQTVCHNFERFERDAPCHSHTINSILVAAILVFSNDFGFVKFVPTAKWVNLVTLNFRIDRNYNIVHNVTYFKSK